MPATTAVVASPGEAFAAALGFAAAAEPEAATLIGLEHEYSVRCSAGSPADFRDLIHGLRLDGRQLDPGDRNAYRLRSGLALTCDEAEAEIASPPVAVRPGFTRELAAWAAGGMQTLQRSLGRRHAIAGYSTHISAAMPAGLNDEAAGLFARTFAPTFALVIERPESQGVYIRPRPGRLELCGDYAFGSRLSAAAVLGAGGARACALALGGQAPALPPEIEVELLPGIERYGHRVRREAYGLDLYAGGRSALLRRTSGGTIAAQEHLDLAAAAAIEALSTSATDGDIAPLVRMVRGQSPLGVEGATEGNVRWAPGPRRSPFGQAIAPGRRRRYALTAVAATWDVTVFQLDSAWRTAFAAVPRDLLALFLERLDRGQLDGVIEAFLAAAPEGRVLCSHDQVAEPGLYDALGDPAGLVARERLPIGLTPADSTGAGEARAGKGSSSAAPARMAKALVGGATRPVSAAIPPEARAAKSETRRWKAVPLPFPGPRGLPVPGPSKPPGRPLIRWFAVGAGGLAVLAAIGFAAVRGGADSGSAGATGRTPTAIVSPTGDASAGAAVAASPSPTPSVAAATSPPAPSPTAVPTAAKTVDAAATSPPPPTPTSGGAAEPPLSTPPPTATATATPTSTPTPRPTETPRPTATPTPSPTATPTIFIPPPPPPPTVVPTTVKGGCTRTPGATC